MICLSVKCLSGQPGSVYTKQGQGSLLFNCQHIPQPGATHSKVADGRVWVMGLQPFPVGTLDITSLFWGKMGCMNLSELEERPFSSQRPFRQGETAKGDGEEVGLRNAGQGDSADPITQPCVQAAGVLASVQGEGGFRQ